MNLFRSASLVSLWTLLSRITGLARELLIASTFGASAMTDAFNVAFRIPNLFRRLFGEGAFSQAFVPVLARSWEQAGDDATQALTDRVATVLAWALLGLSVVGVLAAPALVWLMASGMRPQGFDMAVTLTRWMFPYIAFLSLVALCAGILNTRKRFAVPAATPVLLNLSMIAATLWLAPWLALHRIEPIHALAAGVLLGGVVQLVMQAMALARLGLLPRIAWRWTALRGAWADTSTQEILRLMGPSLLGVGVAHLSMLINTQIASYLRPGSVSWISYADRLMEFPTALLGVALGVVLLPQLSAAHARGDRDEYSAMLDWGLRWVLLLALPCAVALVVFPLPLAAVLYHYGAMTNTDIEQITRALVGWGVGLVGLIAIKVLAPAYYAGLDTRTPVRIAIMVLVFTQLCNALFVGWLAHAALTLSIGLGALVNAAFLLGGLVRRGAYRPAAGWAAFGLRILVACGLLAAFLYGVAAHVDWLALRSAMGMRLALLAAAMLASGVLYFGALHLLGMDLRPLLRRSVHGKGQ
ncbi:murein biosynthesis integral membrane protein MurJ [Candidatus Symbiobacter mobilis]|uniref:Probable lipid II flippase MurJ n=1 Tax=Candidatus Symbiobacter mobilis CR TaxID=946483 RepID=U5NB71_9BURK|nr:murein biosynthesis integral membrane protein MurJ [Candidatus Symbiobacter mobilis]AGX88667.1 virulence factor protein [Candidatus Symbiobacter mobilis CR]